MEWTQLWAGVTFAAQNGDAEGLLTAAAAGGLHLSDIVPRPGGFSARCAAWHYRKLAALARRRRVRLRIQKRQGLFFCIRPLLRRRGLWAGCLVFLPLLLWLQGFVWFVEPVGLTPGQQARAAVVLWEAGLFPGNAVTQEKLAAGEYALLQSGEFSWASLNFMKGKLVAEAAAAKPVPDIAAGTLHGLRARVSGTVVRTNLVSGTMLVVPGQAVEAGQGLIGTARAERDGTLIFQPAAGSVRAQFEWENEQDTALLLPIEQLTGQQAVHRTLFWRPCCRSALSASCSGQGRGRCRRPALPARSLRVSCSCFYRRNDILLQSSHRFGADRRAGSGPCKTAKQTSFTAKLA